MLKQFLLVSSMTAVLLGGFAHGQQAPLAIKRTPLGKVDVPGSNYEVIFGIAELSPGPKTGRHSHPGPVLAYVAEGEFWYLIDGQPEKSTRPASLSRYRTARFTMRERAGTNPSR